MKQTNFAKTEKLPFPFSAAKMLTNKVNEIIRINLKPHEKIAPHVNDFDVAFYIVEGTATIETNNETLEVTADSVVEIEAGNQRALYNNTKETLRILVLKTFKQNNI